METSILACPNKTQYLQGHQVIIEFAKKKCTKLTNNQDPVNNVLQIDNVHFSRNLHRLSLSRKLRIA